MQPPSAKQKRYASNLVGNLLKVSHPKAHEYDRKVSHCASMPDMSSLISRMKAELELEPYKRRLHYVR